MSKKGQGNIMQNAIKAIPIMSTNQVGRGLAKTVVTAAGMTGATIGAYHVKNWVSDVTDNSVLGFAAGITTILVGAVVVTSINKRVDKAFEVKALPTSQPLLVEVPDEFDIGLDDDEVGEYE